LNLRDSSKCDNSRFVQRLLITLDYIIVANTTVTLQSHYPKYMSYHLNFHRSYTQFMASITHLKHTIPERLALYITNNSEVSFHCHTLTLRAFSLAFLLETCLRLSFQDTSLQTFSNVR